MRGILWRYPAVLKISRRLSRRWSQRDSTYFPTPDLEDLTVAAKRLPGPQMVVPGNHDVPLWDIVRRFFFPLERYRRYISENLFPEYLDEELLVLGINTARSFTRTSGWICKEQFEHVRRRTCESPRQLFKVLVTHHPFIPPPRRLKSDVLLHGSSALKQLEECGIDMLLAGHLHLAYHDDVRSHHQSARRSVLSIQAGTATSTRRRGEPNAYNWITISPDLVTVAVRAWNGRGFAESLVTRYEIFASQNVASPFCTVAAEVIPAIGGLQPGRAVVTPVDVFHFCAPVAASSAYSKPSHEPT